MDLQQLAAQHAAEKARLNDRIRDAAQAMREAAGAMASMGRETQHTTTRLACEAMADRLMTKAKGLEADLR